MHSDREKPFQGEDANAGLATPIMDLIAAGALALLAVFVMIESLRLPMPGAVFTAPGLLPFLTGASLLVMAVVLGASAVVRRRATPPEQDRFVIPGDLRRTLVLGAIIVLYALGLQFVPVEQSVTIFGKRLVIGAFEVVSVVVLTGVLRLYWGRPLWLCLTVAFAWIAALSLVFRLAFQTPLP